MDSSLTPEPFLNPRLTFYYVGVNRYTIFFIAATSPRAAKRLAKMNIPWYQRWRKIRVKQDIDPIPLSDRGYAMKLAVADYVQA